MLNRIFILILLAAFAADSTVLALRFVHMLQLNSYRNCRYMRWVKENRTDITEKMGWLLLSMIAVASFLLQKSDWRAMAACSLLFAIHAIINKPKKAKKPLVFTWRVKRLLITFEALLIAVYALVYFTGMLRLGLGLLFLWAALTPFTVPVCNIINRPAENSIAKRYVDDARRILASMPRLTVIGITGSYGKTSTKNFLQALLSSKYNVLMTPESYNTTMGVVRTVRESLRPTHEIFIAEMGAKNKGDIREICELVGPRYGIITSIGEQHLETFKTVENIISTKFELADSIPSDGKLFLNLDCDYISSRTVNAPVVTYGINREDADYTAFGIAVDGNGSSFTVKAPGGEMRHFTTRLLGSHNIQNILGCIAVANTMGISLDQLVLPVRRLKPVAHRLELLPNGIIDDAYNSNPEGFKAALDVLRGFEGQRVLVTPGMVELGQRQHELNRELGFYAASCCDYAVLVGKKQAPPLREGLLAAGFSPDRLIVEDTLADALKAVNSLPEQGKRIVLLENDLPDNY